MLTVPRCLAGQIGFSFLTCTVVCVLFGSTITAAASGVSVDVIASSGDPVPGRGTTLAEVGTGGVMVTVGGDVAFLATDSDGQTMILADRGNGLEVIMRTGEPAPGTRGAFYDQVLSFKMQQDGAVVFRALYEGGDLVDCNNNGFFENDHGLYIDAGGGAQLLLREDDQLPGVSGDVRAALIGNTGANPFGTGFTSFITTRSGQCPFFIEGGQAMLIDRGSGLGPLVLPGDPAPFPDAVFGTTAQLVRWYPSEPEAVAFTAELAGPGFDEANDLAFVVERGGVRTIRLRESDPLPGHAGLTIGPIFWWASLRPDVMSWRADVRRTDGSFTFMHAILRQREEEPIELIAFEDDPAPGIPGATLLLLGLNDPPEADNAHTLGGGARGELSFRAFVIGPGIGESNNEALYYAGEDGRPTLILREGDQAPGFAPGVVIGPGPFFELAIRKPFVNRHGQTVFRARVTGGGLDAIALFAFDPAAERVKHLLRPGDRFELEAQGTGAEVLTIGDFGPTRAGQSPDWTPYRDDGVLALQLHYLDDRGQLGSAAARLDASRFHVRRAGLPR